ncbi:hypothetical protein SAMN05518848_10892 [Paenibacillus sp. PDC88]|nr:hypothetical protein SAMN05518848_10892 [Paenibacillus sp. PDC88]
MFLLNGIRSITRLKYLNKIEYDQSTLPFTYFLIINGSVPEQGLILTYARTSPSNNNKDDVTHNIGLSILYSLVITRQLTASFYVGAHQEREFFRYEEYCCTWRRLRRPHYC